MALVLHAQAGQAQSRQRSSAARRIAAGVLWVLVAGAPAAAAAAGPPQVTLRLVTLERFYHVPIWGTFTASGAITDHGTVSGLFVPVYRRERDGMFGFDAVHLALTGRGTRGSFTLRGKVDLVCCSIGLRERGDLMLIAASGAYRRLAPIVAMKGDDYPGPFLRGTRTVLAALLATAVPYPRRAPL